MHFPPQTGKRCLAVLGLALVAFSVFGFVHAIRLECSEIHYHAARYGRSGKHIDSLLAASHTAHRIWPRNYYACIWAGKTAFHRRLEDGGKHEAERLEEARFWAAEGLAINPHNSELAHLHTEVLALADPAAALAFWEPYVERRFWEPFNHFVLVELYTRLGNLEKAEESLFWLQDTPLFENGAAIIDAAWRSSLSDR